MWLYVGDAGVPYGISTNAQAVPGTPYGIAPTDPGQLPAGLYGAPPGTAAPNPFAQGVEASLPMSSERMWTNVAIGAAIGAAVIGIGKYVFKFKFL